MKNFYACLLSAAVLAAPTACDGGDGVDGSTASSTTGTETDDAGSASMTLSTTITASDSDGTTSESTTDDPSGSAATTDPSGSSATTDPTDPTAGTSTTGDDGVTATVFDIQDGTVGTGTTVLVEGVIVTGVRDGIGMFVQESDGGMNSGIYVGTGDLDTSALAVGDVVDVTGAVTEDSEGALADLTQIDAGGANGIVTDTGVDATATPVTVALSDLGTSASAEPWEGVLVTVDEAVDVMVSEENEFDEFQVSDGADAVWVDDFFFNAYEDAGNFPSMGLGAEYESVTGPLNYTFGDFKVAPRSAADLSGYVSPNIGAADVEDLEAGDLVITEIMYDPSECMDVDCEYIEIYNASGQSVNLSGLVVSDAVNGTASVSASVVLLNGAYGILGQDNWGYNDVTPLAQIDLPAFNNSSADRASISNSSITIDQTATYTPQGTADNGYAWKLDMATPDATANDVAGNWCYAPDTFEGSDYGSPNGANHDGCAVLD